MALADALHGLLRLPGATYSCVVERDTGRVLAETGDGEAGAGDGEGVVPYSVARWGTAVAAMFDATSGDELDDVMITGRRSYHLLRGLGPSASVLVYLRLDRTRSNLAAARRELSTVRWGAAPRPMDAAPTAAQHPAPSRDTVPPARGSRGGGRLRAVGDPDGPRMAVDPPARPAPAAPAPTVGSRVPAALPPGGTPARGLPASARSDPVRSAAGRPDATRSATARPGATRAGSTRSGSTRPVAADPDDPGSRAPATSGASDAGSAGSRAARSRDAGKAHADDTGTADPRPAGPAEQPGRGPQIPLPRRAPRQRPSVLRAGAQSGSDTGSRRRSGGRGAGAGPPSSEESAVPDGFPMPAVLGQSWAKDPGTLRRLIAGLRRMP